MIKEIRLKTLAQIAWGKEEVTIMIIMERNAFRIAKPVCHFLLVSRIVPSVLLSRPQALKVLRISLKMR